MADSPRSVGADLLEHAGACHCGAVRFTVLAPADITVEDCNCSMCRKAGYLHLLVPAAHFKLRAGEERLNTYTFNTAVARHTFCRDCGVKAFYVPRSNPDGYSVNLRCLDTDAFETIKLEAFDGRHWEIHGARLAERTRR